MISRVETKEEWVWEIGDDHLVVLTMDDEEPIKKEVLDIITSLRPELHIIDVAPEVYQQVFTDETYQFAPPGIIFFVKAEPVWRSDLGILSLDDHAWNERILHDMVRKFFGDAVPA